MAKLVDLEIGTLADRVAVVTLDDPARRNALTVAMSDELAAIFDHLEASADVGSVVITGAGTTFCAGADLSHLGAEPTEAGLRAIYEGFLRVARSSLPTVAAVNGPAVGAGMNLALCCDVRMAGRSARFDARFLQLGIHPGGGHTWMMQRLVGTQGALATALFGEVLDGPEAARTGLAWRCVPDDTLLAAATALAGRASAAPPDLVRRLRTTIAEMPDVDTHQEAVDIEIAAQLWSMAQPSFAERLAAMRRTISSR